MKLPLIGGTAISLVATLSLVASGQNAATTHTVARGETLWSIARTYLSDPLKWRVVYEANSDQLTDPNMITPGMVLRIPGTAVQATMPATGQGAAARDSTPPAVVTGAMNVSGQVTASTPMPMRTIPRETAGELRPFVDLYLAPPPPRVRAGEHSSAPWLNEEMSLSAGRLLGFAPDTLSSLSGSAALAQLNDRLVAMLPPGASPDARFVAFRRESAGREVGEVLIPTAELVADPSVMAEGPVLRVVAVFDALRPGDELLVAESFAEQTGAPVAVADGPAGEVVWVRDGALLPTGQTTVIVNVGSSAGVRLGALFTLYGAGASGSMQMPLAYGRAVRVGNSFSTVLIYRVVDGGRAMSAVAKMTARMP